MPRGNKAGYGQNYHKGQLYGSHKMQGYTANYNEQEGGNLSHGPMPARKADLLGQPHEGKFYGTNTVGKGPTKQTNKN